MTAEQMEKISAILDAAVRKFNADGIRNGICCEADFFDDENFYVNVIISRPRMRIAAGSLICEINREVFSELTKALGKRPGYYVSFWNRRGDECDSDSFKTIQYHYYE